MAVITPPRCTCSTTGFEQPHWAGAYYPEECPVEWRLAYFMNDFRSVFLPANDWFGQPQQLAHIAEELEGAFELVVEWPSGVYGVESEAVLDQLEPLRGHIASVVVNVEGAALRSLESLLQAIGHRYAVSLQSTTSLSEAQLALAKDSEAGIVWFPQLQLDPELRGPYQVVRLPCLDLREIRTILSKLTGIVERGIRVGLFIEPGEQSPQRAKEVRTLIELLDLA